MRSAEHSLSISLRLGTAATLVLALSACATVSEGVSSLGQMASSVGKTLMAPLSGDASSSAAPATTSNDKAAGGVSEKPAQKAEQKVAQKATEPSAAPARAPRAPAAPVDARVMRSYDEALRLLRNGRTEDAERALRALVQSNPELGGPHANLAHIHHKAGRLEDAAQSLERAVAASPDQPAYWNELGVVNRELGRFDKAREAYEKALDIEPNHAAATLNLGILYDLYLWQPQRALEQYEKYLALHKGDANVTKWAADVKNRLKATATTAAVKDKEKP
jgi:tetratricopeptide (TPR) repeat protein